MTDQTGQGEEAGTAIETTIPESAMTEKYSPYRDSYDVLEASADTVFGYDLAKDELADNLAGVAFIATSATFRPGIVRDVIEDGAKAKKQFAYVSLETVINPALFVARINVGRAAAKLPKITTLEELPFEPGSHVVINDGSTGIYRQVVEYLNAKGYIKLPDPLIPNGELGESSYDLPPSDWTEANGADDFRYDETGFATAHFNIRLKCPRGLRLSRYSNDYTNGEEATTRYFG